MVGEVIGNYEILESLGRGGSATVYRARRRDTGREVALKVLGCRLDPVMVRRFEREAETLSRLDHPNIVKVYEAGEHDGLLLYAMQYVPGSSLDRVIAEARAGGSVVEARTAFRVTLDVLAALHYIGQLALFHRDLKPANVLVDRTGRALLSDFGLAQFRDRSHLTQDGFVLGTLRYMSPEQVRGDEVDQRSDLYQAGLLLYELTFGDLPYADKNPYSQARLRTQQDLPLPPLPTERLDPELADVIRRACAVDRRDRFPDARHMAAALAAVASRRCPDLQPPGLAEPPTEVLARTGLAAAGRVTEPTVLHGEPPKLPTRRRLRALGPGAVLGLGLALGAAGALLLRPAGRAGDDSLSLARQELERGRPGVAARLLGTDRAAQLRELGPAFAGAARSLASGGRTTEALALLRPASEVSGEDARLAAELSFRAGRDDEGLELALRARRLGAPPTAELAVTAARAAVRRGRAGLAADLLREAVGQGRGDLAARLDLAALLVANRSLDEARTALDGGVGWDAASIEERARRLLLQARLARKAARYDEALALSGQAAALGAANGASSEQAAVYQDRGQGSRALMALRAVADRSPDDASLQADVYRRSVDLGVLPATRYLVALRALDPAAAAPLEVLERLPPRLSPHQAPAAERILSDAAARWPQEPSWVPLLATFVVMQGRYDAALAMADQGLPLYSSSFKLLAARAQALEGLGRLEEAQRACVAVLRCAPYAVEEWVRLLRLEERLPRFEFLADELGELLRLYPDSTSLAVARCHALAHLGRYEELLAVLDRHDGLRTPFVEWSPQREAMGFSDYTAEERARLRRQACRPLRVAALCALGRWDEGALAGEQALAETTGVGRGASAVPFLSAWMEVDSLDLFLRGALAAGEGPRTAFTIAFQEGVAAARTPFNLPPVPAALRPRLERLVPGVEAQFVRLDRQRFHGAGR